jgi:hypothetical protein
MMADIRPPQMVLAPLPYYPIDYHFTEKPLSSSHVPMEAAILQSIQRNHSDLSLYHTTGLVRTELFTLEKFPVYRLQSAKHRAVIDFYFDEYERGIICNVLMLLMRPEYQGNFYTLKDFVIGQVAKTLFDVSVRDRQIVALCGDALGGDFPLRRNSKRPGDWRTRVAPDGSTRLIKVFERLGVQREHLNSSVVTLRREAVASGAESSVSRLCAEQEQGQQA